MHKFYIRCKSSKHIIYIQVIAHKEQLNACSIFNQHNVCNFECFPRPPSLILQHLWSCCSLIFDNFTDYGCYLMINVSRKELSSHIVRGEKKSKGSLNIYVFVYSWEPKLLSQFQDLVFQVIKASWICCGDNLFLPLLSLQ